SLDIGEEPDFLEQLVGQALGFVDDERQDRVVLSPIRNGALKAPEKPRLRPRRFRRKSKLRSQEFEELGPRQRGIRKVHDSRIRVARKVQRPPDKLGLRVSGSPYEN